MIWHVIHVLLRVMVVVLKLSMFLKRIIWVEVSEVNVGFYCECDCEVVLLM